MQIFYTANQGEPFYPRAALSGAAGKTVELAYDERGFRVVLANGMDPVAPEPEEGEEPVEPAPAWESYSSDPQPTPDWVAAWRPVEPEQAPPAPVTDVEKYKEVFVGARQNATLLVDTIKASVQDALVKSGACSASEATIQGVDFVFYHGNDIANYKEAGGHPSAASRLLAAFKSERSAALFPWVKSVEQIFDQALTY